MQGVSRGSLVLVRDKLDSVLSGLSGGGKKDAAAKQLVGEELFAVAALLDGNAQLRRMLSDPAVDADRRERLAGDLLAERLSAPAAEIVTALVRASWGKPKDLVDATDELAAQALFGMAEQVDVLDEVEDELFRFGRILDREPALRRALTDPSLPEDRKTELLAELLGDKVQVATLALVREVVLRPRGRTIDRGLEDYGRLAAARRERLVAQVRTAVPLSSKQLERLGASLEARLGHRVHLNVEVDPGLVGGLTVRVGDVLFDGSIAHRLAVARRVMTG
jgi:F-type H+-transporting ATPase subunit delta